MTDYRRINAIRQAAQRKAETARISEVARLATQLQQQGVSRTDALKSAERAVRHGALA